MAYVNKMGYVTKKLHKTHKRKIFLIKAKTSGRDYTGILWIEGINFPKKM